MNKVIWSLQRDQIKTTVMHWLSGGGPRWNPWLVWYGMVWYGMVWHGGKALFLTTYLCDA
eukprot:scaffold15490_cov177-Skeletonema_dohrnii-CCMP3373.AAC.2